MGSSRMESFRNLIVNRLRVLEGGVPLEQELDGTEKMADELDNSVLQQRRQIDVTLGSIKRAEISELRDALDKFQDDTYGLCEECECPISEKRLRVHPAARLCVHCQEAHEKSGRRGKERFFGEVNIAVLEQRAAR